jgi:hypothetical protein
MTDLKLREEVKEKLLEDVMLQARIAVLTGRTVESVKRWIKYDNSKLRLEPIQAEIKKHLNINEIFHEK